jgi:energy-converting hydrogenase A subunit Q
MITINKQSCDLCGTCVGVCPVDALKIEINELTINYDKCINCSQCIYICPIDALSEDRHEL